MRSTLRLTILIALIWGTSHAPVLAQSRPIRRPALAGMHSFATASPPASFSHPVVNFFPTPFGTLMLTTRQAINPVTGSFLSQSTGRFVIPTRNDNLTLTNTQIEYFNPNAPMMMNPYTTGNPGVTFSMMTAYPVPYANPYAAPTANGMKNNNGVDMKSIVDAPEVMKNRQALGSVGIPTENGHIKWPLAFRLMPPEKKRALTDTLESELLALASESSASTYNPVTVLAARKNVQRLSGWLNAHQSDFAEATYQEGVGFLRTLNTALSMGG